MTENRVGQQLGNYLLTKRLGEGGFAEVYLGTHIYLKTEAALKILHTRLTQVDIDEFVSEAQTIARLKHPHIVRVLEFGVDGNMPFLVLDYAPHGTLRDRHPRGNSLTAAVVLSYLKPIADALQYAHDQKLVHRDVKPENMLIGEHNEILLSDFGIATVAQSSRYQGAQEVAGTVAYMAPEQIQGKPRPASDQYALGIVVYEWLTGTRPFHGSFTEIATQHVLTPPTPLREKLPTIPQVVEGTVLIALAKDPKARFATVHAFVHAFERACLESGERFTSLEPSSTSSSPKAVGIPPTVQARPLQQQSASSGLSSTVLPPAVIIPPTVQARPLQPLTEDFSPTTGTARGLSDPATAFDAGAAFTPAPVWSERGSRAFSPTQDDTSDSFTAPPVHRRPGRKFWAIVGSLILIVLLIGVWSTWASQNSSATFQQEVTDGTNIQNLQVGTAISDTGYALLGQTDTFHSGDQSCIFFKVYTNSSSGNVDVVLYQGNNQFFAGPVEENILRGLEGLPLYKCSNVGDPGIYKWVVNYNGSAQASITFQVVAR